MANAGEKPTRTRLGMGITTILVIVGFPHVTESQDTIILRPGDDLQAAAVSHPPGTRFLLTEGVYRLQEISPKDGQQFIGELDPEERRLAVLNGARVLSDWQFDGNLWYVSQQTQGQRQHGVCEDPEYPVCRYAEELFVDGEHQSQVLSLGDLRPGRWYFDYELDRIFLAENPDGRLVETSVANRAITGPANDVIVRNLVIEKYANIAQEGAIDSRSHSSAPFSTGANWLVENNEVRWNHAIGIRLTNGGLGRDNYVHHNGQAGVKGVGEDITYVNNEISYNNFAGFRRSYEAGGAKFAKTTDLIIAHNYVYHNDGPGLWIDADCLKTLILGNRVEFNRHQGVSFEISYTGRIEGNLIVGNGFGFPSWGWGGGIVVSASPNVEVVGNVVIRNADGIVGIQQNRGRGTFGPHTLKNLSVAGNCIQQVDDGWTGVLDDTGTIETFCCRNNRFKENTYVLPKPDARSLSWNFHRMGIDEWRIHHPSDAKDHGCAAKDQWEFFFYVDSLVERREAGMRIDRPN